jgi:hypothetical protein
VRRRGSKAASSEAETRSGVRVPRVRRRLARQGVRPSSEAEAPWRGVWSSCETETRPRGTAAGRLVGRCGFLGRGPFFASSRDHAKCVLWFVSLFVCLPFIIFRKGCFPQLLGDPYGCHRQKLCIPKFISKLNYQYFPSHFLRLQTKSQIILFNVFHRICVLTSSKQCSQNYIFR